MVKIICLKSRKMHLLTASFTESVNLYTDNLATKHKKLFSKYSLKYNCSTVTYFKSLTASSTESF